MAQLNDIQIEARREEMYNKIPFSDIFCKKMTEEGIGDFWDNWKWYVNKLDKKHNRKI